MTPHALWGRVAGAAAGAALLLVLVPPPRSGWPAPAALAAGAFAGGGLFVAAARQLPPLPRPQPGRWRVWAAKHGVLALLAGVEEVVWRSCVLGWLALVVPPAAALALVSVAFALWHRPPRPEHLAAGLVFGGLFLAGGLAAAWAAHLAYNTAVAAADESPRARAGGAPP